MSTNLGEPQGKYSRRIRAHFIAKKLVGRFDLAGRTTALNLTASEAERQIKKLRHDPLRDYRSGIEHAFWVQRYANAKLALAELGS